TCDMIPRIIHYCWFGGNPLGQKEEKIIATWEKYCPDYKVMVWNEDNFNVDQMGDYVKEAYQAKKWAFVSDVARLYALTQYRGIYIYTHMDVITPLHLILKLEAFMDFEEETTISTANIAAKENNPTFKLLYDNHNDRHYINDDGSYHETTNVIRITEI